MVDSLYDCYSVLHMNIPVGAEACATARATIRAAEIQAKATRSAGGQGLVAGTLAFIAGVLAFSASALETYRLHKIHRLNNRAYSLKLLKVLEHAQVEIAHMVECFQRAHTTSKKCLAGTWPDTNFGVTYMALAREVLKFEHWSDVANLPRKAIELSVIIDDGINGAINDFVAVRTLIDEEKSLLATASSSDIVRIGTVRVNIENITSRRIEKIKETITSIREVEGIIKEVYPVKR